jgi:reductive dehalogenase
MPYTLGGKEIGLYHATGSRSDLGIPRWEATPEENLHTLAAAIHFYGGREIGAVEITDKTKKVWYSYDSRGRPYTFEDVDEPYSDSEKASVTPNKCRWVINWNTYQSGLSRYNAPEGFNVLNKAATHQGYSDASIQIARVQFFLRTLGYQAVSSRCGGNNVGLGVLAGLSEHGRTDYGISPVKGALVRVAQFMVTDLPLAPTKPIDAGIWRFCQTCKKCSELCPAGAMSMDNEPSYENLNQGNGYGLKSYHVDYPACHPYRGGPGGLVLGGCGICQGVCVFTKLSNAAIHDVVKTTIGVTGLFDGFFRQMDDLFNYGDFLEPKDFWERDFESFPSKGSQTGL